MNAGVTGPFGWITSGQVDVDFFLFIPQISDDLQLMNLIRDEIAEIKAASIDKLEDILQDPGTIQRLEESISDTPVVAPTQQVMAKREGETDSSDAVVLDQRLYMDHEAVEGSDYASSRRDDKQYNLYGPAYRSAKLARSNYRTNTDYATKSSSSRPSLLASALDMSTSMMPPPAPPRVMEFEKHYHRVSSSSSSLSTSRHSFPVIVPPATSPDGGDPPNVVMRWSVTLNDLRASVPALDKADISYLNNVMIRPIVAYMNAHRSRIPLAFEGRMPLVGVRERNYLSHVHYIHTRVFAFHISFLLTA